MLNNLDIFAASPFWLIKGSSKSGTRTGMFLTLSLISLFIWAAILFSADMRDRKNPQVTQYSKNGFTYDDVIELGIDSVDYLFGLSLYGQNRNFEYFDKSVILVQAEYQTNEGESTYYDMIPCSADLINKTIFSTGTMYCIDYAHKYPIQGINSQVVINFMACVNGSVSNVTCREPEYIEHVINNFEMTIAYNTYTVNPTEYHNPITKNRDYIGVSTAPGFYKQVYAVFSRIDMTTDDGFFFKDTSLIQQASHTSFITDFTLATTEHFMSIYIYNTGTAITFNRVFVKLQDFLAKLMGIMNISITLIALFARPFSRLKFYEYISNELFSKQIKEMFNLNKKRSKNLQNSNPPPKLPPLKNIKNESFSKNESNDSIVSIVESPHPKQFRIKKPKISMEHISKDPPDKPKKIPKVQTEPEILHIGLCEWVASKFKWKKNIKLEFLHKVQDEIDQLLDIPSLCKIMSQFALLKHIVMTKNQRLLFEHIDLFKNALKRPVHTTDLFTDPETHNRRMLESAKLEILSRPSKSDLELELITLLEDQAPLNNNLPK